MCSTHHLIHLSSAPGQVGVTYREGKAPSSTQGYAAFSRGAWVLSSGVRLLSRPDLEFDLIEDVGAPPHILRAILVALPHPFCLPAGSQGRAGTCFSQGRVAIALTPSRILSGKGGWGDLAEESLFLGLTCAHPRPRAAPALCPDPWSLQGSSWATLTSPDASPVLSPCQVGQPPSLSYWPAQVSCRHSRRQGCWGWTPGPDRSWILGRLGQGRL